MFCCHKISRLRYLILGSQNGSPISGVTSLYLSLKAHSDTSLQNSSCMELLMKKPMSMPSECCCWRLLLDAPL
nr:hypothetical protein ZOSMA_169G00290 [Ipomoea batatas]